MPIVDHIQYALNNSTPITEFYLWIINNLDLPKITSRLIDGSPKVVFAQFDRRERLPISGNFVMHMFDTIGTQMFETLFGNVKVYRRRKPYHVGGGYTNLSNNTFQIVIQFKPDVQRVITYYTRDDDTFSVNL
jgi:hypothetical protein